MLDIIGSTLAQTFGVALSPIPLIAVIALFHKGRVPAFFFTLGWFVGVTGVMAVTMLGASAAASANQDSASTGVNWFQLAVGVLFVGFAYRQFVTRPKTANPDPPKWIEALGSLGPLRDFALGAVLIVANAKNIPLLLALGAKVGSTEALSDVQQWITVIVLGLLSTGFAIAILLLTLTAGGRAIVERLDGFMIRYNHIIMALLFGFLGLQMIGGALAAT